MAIGWYVDPVSSGTAMTAVPRCEWVVQQVQQHDHGKPPSKLRQQYATEASDVNSFYRGTAFLFWEDFVNGGWGPFDLSALGVAHIVGVEWLHDVLNEDVVHHYVLTKASDKHCHSDGEWIFG